LKTVSGGKISLYQFKISEIDRDIKEEADTFLREYEEDAATAEHRKVEAKENQARMNRLKFEESNAKPAAHFQMGGGRRRRGSTGDPKCILDMDEAFKVRRELVQ
jgi:hypothetical protein